MKPMQLLVIGGVAGGLSFATRARRLNEEAEITVLERGPDISFANCGLPYHIGGEIPNRQSLTIQTPQSLKDMFRLNVRINCNALQIDREKKRVLVVDRISNEQEWIAYDKLMLAPGARPAMPDIPGIDDPAVFTLRNLQDMDRIIAIARPDMRAVVVGGGYVGLELLEQLHKKGLKTSLVHLHSHVLHQFDSQVIQPLQNELKANGVQTYFNNHFTSFSREGEVLKCQLARGDVVETDMVIFSIGVRPESDLAREAGLVLSEAGHVVVNQFMQTSDPDIYAAGDVVQTRERHYGQRVAIALAGPANRQGRVAADHIFQEIFAQPYPGSIGTSIVRLFGMVAAGTGWTEQALIESGRSYNTVTVHEHQHASYYPGAEMITLKLIWEPESGKILGAQATGKDGVDKRIDVLATAIIGRMTIDDLCHLELAYAPPFGTARDIINIAGFAATNMRDGLIRLIHTIPDDPAVQLLDVRSRQLVERSPVEGAIHIPFPALRKNLGKLDKNKPVIVICQLGRTSYFASRVLSQNGFHAVSLTGGIRGLGHTEKSGVYTPCTTCSSI
ncbi:FAD-dependent oxidoreductase [Oxalobacter vibrioformis]|uniref:FAD-dependent oxidoreductase n=1 Tax=Oxalobacter vibrioformis TaxID=933080 RepID=A0A9E9LY23_9BURK|nr:FAD-dependent oxidoreductase [Oxalobacter vibrioformis]WAW09670.1 FAD-dependent oxidoreductase [Oxalobacter vibrioformis]